MLAAAGRKTGLIMTNTRKRNTPEQVVRKLGQADRMLADGADGDAPGVHRLTVTNDRPTPAAFEGDMQAEVIRPEGGATIVRRNGRPLWRVIVPANGTATLRFRVVS